MEVADRIQARSAGLTAAERRIAAVVLASPQTVAFGTVAELADAANAGAATVVRLAGKLGFDGFTELQASVQRDLTNQLRPAAERIREAAGPTSVERHRAAELANVDATLTAVDQAALDDLVARLADVARPVVVLSGEESHGVAAMFVDRLQLLRPGVDLVGGSDVAVRRSIAVLAPAATVAVIDVRRYDRWVLDAVAQVRGPERWIAAVTDSVLSPLAAVADRTFVVAAGSIGPFDSHVGTLALLGLVVAETAAALRSSATGRIDLVERAWRDGGALTEG